MNASGPKISERRPSCQRRHISICQSRSWGHHVPLRQEEVVVVLSVDVRDSPLVSNDLDRFPQAGNVQLSADLSQGPARQLLQRNGLRRWGATCSQEQQTHHHTSESAWIEGHGPLLLR